VLLTAKFVSLLIVIASGAKQSSAAGAALGCFFASLIAMTKLDIASTKALTA
jgi:hypothetical protein